MPARPDGVRVIPRNSDLDSHSETQDVDHFRGGNDAFTSGSFAKN